MTEITAEMLVAEERERERNNPSPSVLDDPSVISFLPDHMKQQIYAKPDKLLGFITDKMRLAQEFIDVCPLYYDEASIFWRWNSQRWFWERIDDLDVLNWIDSSAVVNIINTKERTELLNALKSIARRRKPQELPVTAIQFDREIIDVMTGDRWNANPRLFCTNPIPWKFGKTPETPTFDKLFKEWTTKPEDYECLHQIIGYCLLPDYPIERIFCLHGAGANGKSVYRMIVRTLLGEKNCCSTSLDLLTHNRFEGSRLYKKLLCEMGETNLAKLENTDVIKKLVSNKDLIRGEYKHKGSFDFINYAKLLISTNTLPPTDDQTVGFYRRWRIIDFPREFTKEIDVLATIPPSEYENLANKAFCALYEVLKSRTFAGDGTFTERKEAYESRANPFERFWKEMIDDGDPNGSIPVWELNKTFNDWAKDHRVREMSESSIGRFLKAKGIEQRRLWKEWYEDTEQRSKQVRCWIGISWRKNGL